MAALNSRSLYYSNFWKWIKKTMWHVSGSAKQAMYLIKKMAQLTLKWRSGKMMSSTDHSSHWYFKTTCTRLKRFRYFPKKWLNYKLELFSVLADHPVNQYGVIKPEIRKFAKRIWFSWLISWPPDTTGLKFKWLSTIFGWRISKRPLATL